MVLRFIFCSQKPLTHSDVSRSSCDIWLHWSQVFHILNNSNLRKSKRFLKNCKLFLEWNYIRRILRHGDQCGLSYSFGLAYLFLGLDGFYGKVHVDGKLWPATCCGQVTFPAASSVPWTCREPSESLPLREKKIHLNVPFCIKGPYQGFSQQKASKRTPHWVRPKMWKIKNKNRRLL